MEENKSDIEVGKRLRSLRKIRGISLQQLSKSTGMSYSYLSGLENGKHSVSITNLQRLASFFEVDMIFFLQQSGSVPNVFTPGDMFAPDEDRDHIIYRVVTPENTKYLQMSYVFLPPHEPSERHIHKHGEGQEIILSLDGSVHVMVGEESYCLGPGDSIHFESNIEHLIYAEEEACSFVIISSPPYGQNILSTVEDDEED